MRSSREWSVTTADGVTLHVELWPAERADAPLVLGLHGITANRRGFLPLVEAFAADVDFLAIDARGRGKSDKPTEPAAYGHRRHAEDAAEVLRSIGRRADVVVGQSMGAWHGLLLAAHHPELVGALVLGDGGYFADLPDGTTPEQYVDGVMGPGWQDRLTAVAPSRDVLFAVLKQVPPFAASWSPALEAMFDAGLEELPGGQVRNVCSPVAAQVDAVDYFTVRPGDAVPYPRVALADVGCPVRLVRAPRGFDISPQTQEPLLSEAAVEGFRAELPQLVVETVPDTNHYTVNFGPVGVAALATAVRESLPAPVAAG